MIGTLHVNDSVSPLEADDIAVVVCTRDRAPLLERYLLPFLTRIAARGITVVIVDQSETEATAELVEAVPGIRYLRASPGLSIARNVGVQATSEPVVAFTDDDVTPPPDWLERIAATFVDPEVGMVLGRAVDSHGAEQPGSRQTVHRHPIQPFGIGSGMNMAVRRQALVDAGPFDPDFGAGARFRAAEDTDMMYRVAEAGWAISCRDDITVVHQTWRDLRTELRVHHGYGMGAGAQCAKQALRGDPHAWRIFAKAAALDLVTIVRRGVVLDLRSVRLQFAFLSGMALGALRYRRSDIDASR